MLPSFDESGNLPPGVHEATWDEIVKRYGTTQHRSGLLAGFREALESLKGAGCRRAYLDGSFVTSREQLGDFDACWEAAGVDPEKLDPVLLDFSDRRAGQKARFGGEPFPAELAAEPGGTTFLEFFQSDRDTQRRKGIFSIDIGAWA